MNPQKQLPKKKFKLIKVGEAFKYNLNFFIKLNESCITHNALLVRDNYPISFRDETMVEIITSYFN